MNVNAVSVIVSASSVTAGPNGAKNATSPVASPP